jgi:hypothetical protein
MGDKKGVTAKTGTTNQAATPVGPPEVKVNYAFGSTPIWTNPCFVDLFLDSLRDVGPRPKPVRNDAIINHSHMTDCDQTLNYRLILQRLHLHWTY